MEQKRFINVYIALGSNMGDRLANVKKAEQMIDRRIGRVARRSSYYETSAWGVTNQNDYINSVIMINTLLSPREILEENQKIERELGREITGERWGPRVVDIDILFYGRRVIRDKGLELPHPQIQHRNFVLIPLMEIAEDFEHPILKKDMITLYSETSDQSDVVMLNLDVQKKVKPFQSSNRNEPANERPDRNPEHAEPRKSRPAKVANRDEPARPQGKRTTSQGESKKPRPTRTTPAESKKQRPSRPSEGESKKPRPTRTSQSGSNKTRSNRPPKI